MRWFQYGVWCPLFRLHGDRSPGPAFPGMSGGPNEVWSYGEDVYEILAGHPAPSGADQALLLEQMAVAAAEGVPPMRPLWFEFPDDKTLGPSTTQFCFGPSVLVAPVTVLGARSRHVYLPAGATWTDRGPARPRRAAPGSRRPRPWSASPFTSATAHS